MHSNDTYNRNTTEWISYNGREILIKDIEVRHLVNILNHMKTANNDHGGVYDADLIALMVAEADLRVMVGFTKNIGIPKRQEDGYYTLENLSDEEKAIEDVKTAMHRQKMEAQIREKEWNKEYKKAKKDRPLELDPV